MRGSADVEPLCPAWLGPNAVIFAVASNAARREQALLNGAHFLLNRPIQASELRQTLNTAYDLMYKERRRYFRCAAA
jgi:AmiR/NasT family two-component response regulator